MNHSTKCTLLIRAFQVADEAAVVALWHRCDLVRPWNDPHADIRRKLTTQPELFFVGLCDTVLVATAMTGFDGHRGWVNYLAVDPGHRNKSFGRLLMTHVEHTFHALGCPKVNLQVRTSNQAATAFYLRLGYRPEQAVSFGKRLIVDAISPPLLHDPNMPA